MYELIISIIFNTMDTGTKTNKTTNTCMTGEGIQIVQNFFYVKKVKLFKVSFQLPL